jgi:hypothetical protein
MTLEGQFPHAARMNRLDHFNCKSWFVTVLPPQVKPDGTLTLRAPAIHDRRKIMAGSKAAATALHGDTPWLKEHRF